MRATYFVFAFLLLLVSITGCTGYAAYMKTGQSFDQTDFRRIEVYSTMQPPKDYEVLGYVSTYSSSANREGDLLKENLKKHAAKYGAHAIIGFRLNIAISGGGGAQGVAVRFLH